MKKNRWVRIHNLHDIHSRGITGQPLTEFEKKVYAGYREMRNQGHTLISAYHVNDDVRFKSDNIESIRRMRLHQYN